MTGRSITIGLNPFPAFAAVKSEAYTPESYTRALLQEDLRTEQAAAGNVLVIRDEAFIAQHVPSTVSLKLASSKSVLERLPEEAAGPLQEQQARLLERYWRELPRLDGETIESLDLAVMTAPYLSFPSGSLVALRTSNLAAVQFIMPWIRVDRRNGIPVVQGLNNQNLAQDSFESMPKGALKLFVDAPAERIASYSSANLPSAGLCLRPHGAGPSLWDYISQIGGCVIWVAPMPWNAIGAGVITALRLFFGEEGSGASLFDSIFTSVKNLLGQSKLDDQMAIFSAYNRKLSEIQGLMAVRCREMPLSNELINNQKWLGDGDESLYHQLRQIESANESIRANSKLFDPEETIGYHSAYVMGVLFQVQCCGMIAKMKAQYATNIGQCQPADLDVEKFVNLPAAAPRISDTPNFLNATEDFQEAYIKFRNLCVGYLDPSNHILQPGRYQELSKFAHDIWYEKIRSLTGVIPYCVTNMYNEVWWRYGTWLDVNDGYNAQKDDDLAINPDAKKKVEELYQRIKDPDDRKFWRALSDFQRYDAGRLGHQELIAFCQLVKAQFSYEPEHWPIYSELEVILARIGWEDPKQYDSKNPMEHASPWVIQFTESRPVLPQIQGHTDPCWWLGPAAVDDDKKTPQPLCRAVAAEVLELFLTKQYRTFGHYYGSGCDALNKHRVESDRTVHNICCTDQYEVSFTDHFDQVLQDRDRQFVDYLSRFNLPNIISTARQIHDSVYSVSSLMAPLPPADPPVCRAMGKPPATSHWQAGNIIVYRYSYRNSGGPSAASPEGAFTLTSAETGVQLTLAQDPLQEASQFLIYRKITDASGQTILEDFRPIGGGKITPGLTDPPLYKDYR